MGLFLLGDFMFHTTSPDTSDQGIENQIQTKGLNAPRVTPSQVEESIASEYYFTAGQGISGEKQDHPDNPQYCYEQSLDLLTFCVLVLRNGFTVTGESACASPENFDAEIGRQIARTHAVNKIWPLLGYALKDRLSGAV
jgi:hypothetical protein